MALTVLELIRHTFFDTKELPPDGSCDRLEFFEKPNSNYQLSNWPVEGVLPHPRQFYMFGLLLNIYSVDSSEPFANLKVFQRKLIEDCNISYIIGHAYHLQVPVLSTIRGQMPETHKSLFKAPKVDGEFDSSNQIMPNKIEKIPGHIANPEPGDFFYNTCIFREKEWVPAHILCEQFAQAVLTWSEAKKYSTDILGKVHFRVSMLGVLAREK